MKKIKIAVIGCGNIANGAHIPAYMRNENAEIKYFCDIIPEKAEAAVKQYDCGTAITDYKIALNDPEIDAVSVCTHTDMHYVISIDAMRAGKDVLSEKPVGRTLKEAAEMLKVQQETGRILVIGVVNRYNEHVNKIRELVAQGVLGDIYHTYISFRAFRSIPGLGGDFTTKSVSGGGVLMDWGEHYIDLVMYILNDPEIKSVSGKTYGYIGSQMKDYVYENMWASEKKNTLTGTFDVDDFATALIRTKNNSTISMNGAWAQNVFETDTFIDFLGTKAGIRLNYCGNFKLYSIKDGKLDTEIIDLPTVNMYDTEINAFVDSVVTRKKLPNDITYAIKTAKILEGINISSDTDKEYVF